MEIKIPKEVRKYRESIFFGLSARQFICSFVAIAAAVAVYFWLAPALGQEGVSWVCILVAAPFAAAGFFSYHSMALEQFLVAWFRSEFFCAGPRKFIAENFYVSLLEDIRREERQKQKRNNAKAALSRIKRLLKMKEGRENEK